MLTRLQFGDMGFGALSGLLGFALGLIEFRMTQQFLQDLSASSMKIRSTIPNFHAKIRPAPQLTQLA